MKVLETKLLFLDTESAVNGASHGVAKFHLPTQAFSTFSGEYQQLTLLNFEMRRSWYNINDSNNKFYLFSATGSHLEEVTIVPGTYSEYTDLATAIALAINDALPAYVTGSGIGSIALAATSPVTYSPISRKFSITFVDSGDTEVICFHAKGQAPPHANVSLSGLFNDSYVILGAVPCRDVNTFVPALKKTGEVHASHHPASLSSLTAIYLRCNLQTGNWQSDSYSLTTVDSNRVHESDIIARIAVDSTNYQAPDLYIIDFEDSGGDMFRFPLQQKALSQLYLSVTDARGRPLQEVSSTQRDLGLLNFTCTFRWDRCSHA